MARLLAAGAVAAAVGVGLAGCGDDPDAGATRGDGEHKITVDSQSSYAFDSVPFGPVDLRIVRIGDVFELSFKLPADASWTSSATYVVPQMPATVEVGLMAYANASPIDLQVDFDAFDLSP